MDNKLLEKKIDSLLLSATTLKVASREFGKSVLSFEEIIDDLERDDIQLSDELALKLEKVESLFEELGFGNTKLI
ncbi:MAG: hypothetical protein ACRC18_06430 [Cetobacterium sp.]